MKITGRSVLCSVLAALLLLTFAMPALAADSNEIVSGDIVYRKTDAGLSVAGWAKDAQPKDTLTIPGTVEGMPVVSIADSAFVGDQKLKTISVPQSLTSVGRSAFEGSVIESFEVGNGVTSMGSNAFANTKLTTAEFDALTKVPENAFSGCAQLTMVSFEQAETIGVSALSGCKALTCATLSKAIEIGNQAFLNCESLDNITAPEVTTVGASAFKNCASLPFDANATSNSFGKVTTIGASAFAGTKAKKLVSTTVTYVGDAAFFQCEEFESVTLGTPDTLRIGNSTFEGCKKLHTVSLPSTLQSIGSNALKGTLFDPNTVSGGITTVQQIYFDGTKSQWNRVTGSSEYSTYRIKWAGDSTSTPAIPEADNSWNPMQRHDWASYVERTSSGEQTVSRPAVGQEFFFRATAQEGTMSFSIDITSPGNVHVEIATTKVYLDSSKGGVGDGMRSCEIPISISGKPGDTIKVKLTGTYTLGGINYPIEYVMPDLVLRAGLDIESTTSLQNLTKGTPVTLRAVWGPPVVNANYTWRCVDPDGKESWLNPESNPSNGSVANFTPSKRGVYTVTCYGEEQGSGTLKDSKMIYVKVLDSMTPEISGVDMLKNMQPGDSAPLRVVWPGGTPNVYGLKYAWTCTKGGGAADQSALSGNVHSSEISFVAKTAGNYVVACQVTVQPTSNPTSWYIEEVQANPVVVEHSLTMREGSAAADPATTPVMSVGDSPKTLNVAWDPAIAAGESVKYKWSCTRNGSDVTYAALRPTPTSSDSTASFQPLDDGDYVIRCTSTRQIGEGRSITKSASFKYRVGATVTLAASTDGKTLENGQQIKKGAEVTVDATVQPSSANPDLTWKLSGGKWKDGTAPTATDKSVQFVAQSGTVTVTCVVGSGSSAKQVKLQFEVVGEYTMKIEATPNGEGEYAGQYVVDGTNVKAIELKATMDGFETGDAYVWLPVTGATLQDGGNGTATFKASKTGTYMITCVVMRPTTTATGGTSSKEIARQTYSMRLIRPASAADRLSKLSILSSLPLTGTSTLKIAKGTPLTLSVAWEKGVPANAATQWSIEQIFVSEDEAKNTTPDHSLPAGATVIPNGEVRVPVALDSIGADSTASQLIIYSNESSSNVLQAGQYDVTLTSGSDYSAKLSLQIYDTPILKIQGKKTGTNLGMAKMPETVYVKPGQAVTYELESTWEGWAPTDHQNLRVWYTWTCTHSENGNVTKDLEDNANNPSFEVRPDANSTGATLFIPGTAQDGESYTVKCVSTGTMPTSIASNKVATVTFVVHDDEASATSLAVSDNFENVEPQIAEDSRLHSMLASNAPVQLTRSSRSGETRVTGLHVAAAGAVKWTVGDILDSFETAENESIAVVDRNGTERTDSDAAIVTGDVVELRDNAQRGIVEQAAVVVMGDMLGTGEMNLSQLVAMAKGMKDENALSGPYMEAGDWDGNNKINLSDLVMQAGELKKSLGV